MKNLLLSDERLENYNAIYLYTRSDYEKISAKLVKRMIEKNVTIRVIGYDDENNTLFIDFYFLEKFRE